MHDTARFYGERFLDTYTLSVKKLSPVPKVLEVGSGPDLTFKNKCNQLGITYQGMDQNHSPDPDVIYRLPAEDNSVDIVVSSSCLEHDEFFWLTFLEIMRVLKPHGLLYLNVPSDGPYHKYPVDCWRWYPDSANALAKWGRKNRIPAIVLETFIGSKMKDVWQDNISVMIKDEKFLSSYPDRILNNLEHRVQNEYKLASTNPV
jgi:SAM-dependent methyltransferase